MNRTYGTSAKIAYRIANARQCLESATERLEELQRELEVVADFNVLDVRWEIARTNELIAQMAAFDIKLADLQ